MKLMTKEEAQALIDEVNQLPGWKAEIAKGDPLPAIHLAYQVGTKIIDGLMNDVAAWPVYQEAFEIAMKEASDDQTS